MNDRAKLHLMIIQHKFYEILTYDFENIKSTFSKYFSNHEINHKIEL